MARTRRGFTLVEILIALAIMAVIATLGYRALATLTDSEVRLSAEATRWRTLDAALARLESDVRRALPRAARVGGTSEPGWVAAVDSYGNTELRLSRAGSEFEADPGAAGQRIGYRLREGTLEIVYWPHLDQPAAVAGKAYALVEDVREFRISFLGTGQAWWPRWPALGESAIPDGARVELTLADGSRIVRLLALR